MRTRLRVALTVALVGQAAMEALVAVWAGPLITGIGPSDLPVSLEQSVARGEEVGAVTTALAILAVLSLFSAQRVVRQASYAPTPLGLAHAAGGGIVSTFGAPVLGALLVILGLGWLTVQEWLSRWSREEQPRTLR